MKFLYRNFALPAVLISAASVASVHAAPTYAFNELMPATGLNSEAYAINNHGVVVGASGIFSTFLPFVIDQTATIWRNGTASLIQPDGNRSSAAAINDVGRIVGFSQGSAAQWAGAAPATLLPSGSSATAAGVNGMNVVVGSTRMPGEEHSVATIWTNEVAVHLAGLGGSSAAAAINDAGTVVGHSYVPSPDVGYYSAAMMWVNGMAVQLTGLGGLGSWASDVNDEGLIVGASAMANAQVQAVVWRDGVAIGLESLSQNNAVANAINNVGQIVGGALSWDGARRAILWEDGILHDLNDMLESEARTAGWVLLNANDINDHGWIVGDAYNRFSGKFSAYMLSVEQKSEVPEPKSGMLLTLALAACAGFSRRRLN